MVAGTDVVSYYVVAQDNANNISVFPNAGATGFSASPPAVSTPPTTPSTYTTSFGVLAPGTYTVGTGGTYTTLTAAVAAYNSSCLSGAVVFSLINTTYPGETFPIIIESNVSASATNTLTIKPAVGVSPTITGFSTGVIVKLVGADFITIDGSNTIGGTTRNLTISNTNTATGAIYGVIWNSSKGSTDGATNNTFKNLNILGATSTNGFGIFSGGSGVFPAGADLANNNTVIQNNAIARSLHGIGVAGSVGGDTGNLITQNTIGSTTATDYMGLRGMFFRDNNGMQVTNNTITGVVGANTIGINILNGNTNCVFNANIITNVDHNVATAGGGRGISVNVGLAANNTISNNVISEIKGQGGNSLTGGIGGITIISCNGIKIYNNSVNLGSGSFAGNVAGTTSVAFYVAALASGIDVRNNIFAINLVNSAVATAKSYAIYSDAPNTVFTNINNNDYFVSGTQGVLGFLASDRVLLADVVTGFGQNAASVSIDPAFTTATNLLPTAATLNNLGTPIAGITTDILGITRNATTPDMGAYEFGVATCSTLSNGTNIVPAGTVGGAYSFSGAVTSAPATMAITYTIAPALTNGLAFNTATGEISATSITGSTGTFPYVISALQTTPSTCTAVVRSISIVIGAAPITCSVTTIGTNIVPAGTVGGAYSFSGAVTSAPATTAITYSISPTLTNGLAFNVATGEISATAITGVANTATYVISALQIVPSGCTAVTRSISIVIGAVAVCPTITISTTTAGVATVGIAYTLNAGAITTSGTLIYSVSPALPAGFSISASGLITSIPANMVATPSTTYTVRAETSSTCFATQNYTFAVNLGTNQNPATSIDNSLGNQVKVSPNPSSSYFNIDFGNINMTKSLVRVYDAQGKQVYFSENNTNLMIISLGNFANGIYLMEVETSKGRIIKRFAKQ